MISPMLSSSVSSSVKWRWQRARDFNLTLHPTLPLHASTSIFFSVLCAEWNYDKFTDQKMNWCLSGMVKRQGRQPQWPWEGEVTMPHSGRPGNQYQHQREGHHHHHHRHQHDHHHHHCHHCQDGWHRRAPAWAKPGLVIVFFCSHTIYCAYQSCISNFWFPRRSICDP